MVPHEFEDDLAAHGYVNDPMPARKEIRPDPKLVEIVREQMSLAMATPAAMFALSAIALFVFAIK